MNWTIVVASVPSAEGKFDGIATVTTQMGSVQQADNRPIDDRVGVTGCSVKPHRKG
jgi:hypothetical protein